MFPHAPRRNQHSTTGTGRKASVIRVRSAPGPGSALHTSRRNNGHLIALGCPHSFIPWDREVAGKLSTLARAHTPHQRTKPRPSAAFVLPPARRGEGFLSGPDAAFRFNRQSLVQRRQWMTGDEQLCPRDTGPRDRGIESVGTTAFWLSLALSCSRLTE